MPGGIRSMKIYTVICFPPGSHPVGNKRRRSGLFCGWAFYNNVLLPAGGGERVLFVLNRLIKLSHSASGILICISHLLTAHQHRKERSLHYWTIWFYAYPVTPVSADEGYNILRLVEILFGLCLIGLKVARLRSLMMVQNRRGQDGSKKRLRQRNLRILDDVIDSFPLPKPVKELTLRGKTNLSSGLVMPGTIFLDGKCLMKPIIISALFVSLFAFTLLMQSGPMTCNVCLITASNDTQPRQQYRLYQFWKSWRWSEESGSVIKLDIPSGEAKQTWRLIREQEPLLSHYVEKMKNRRRGCSQLLRIWWYRWCLLTVMNAMGQETSTVSCKPGTIRFPEVSFRMALMALVASRLKTWSLSATAGTAIYDTTV